MRQEYQGQTPETRQGKVPDPKNSYVPEIASRQSGQEGQTNRTLASQHLSLSPNDRDQVPFANRFRFRFRFSSPRMEIEVGAGKSGQGAESIRSVPSTCVVRSDENQLQVTMANQRKMENGDMTQG